MAESDPIAGEPAGGDASGGHSPVTGRQPVSPRALVALLVVAILVYAADQLSKLWVVENLTPFEERPFLGELLQFEFVRNPGAAFSLASGYTWVFAIIASAVTVFIVWFSHRIRSLGWAVLFGMLLGGTLGNLTDRLFREPGFGVGHVIDFLSLWMFPAIFNIADVAIVSSMVLFVLLTLRGVGLDGSRAPAKRPREPEGAPRTDG